MKSGDEIKESYISSMGEDLGKFYYYLWREVAYLHAKWIEYNTLFTKESRIALINEAGSGFFKIVQDVLWRDILLHVCRLTDPIKSAGRENLTICALPSHIQNDLIRTQTIKLIDCAVLRAQPIRERRNRHMAHLDLNWALEHEQALALPETTTKDVSACIEGISNVLISLSRDFRDTDLIFDSIRLRKGAEGLLYIINDGLLKKREKTMRIKTGKYTEEDLKQIII